MPAAPQKVNVSVDMPQTAAPATEVKEEKSPTWFWDLLQDVPKEKWGAEFDVLGFRIDPKPGVAAGAKGFLFQAFEAITPMWIKQNYGGGRFRCILEQKSRFKTSHEFEIEGQPKYDLTRELPNVPAATANATDSKLLTILEAQISRLNDQLAASQAQGKENPALGEAISMLSTAYKESVATLGSTANNGGSSTQQLSELVGIVKGLLPAQGSEASVLGMILKPLLERVLAPVDPMAQVTMFLTIFEKIDAIRGGGGGGDSRAKDWRAMLAEGAVQKGPEILRELRETFQVNKETAQERRIAAEAIERVETIRRTAPGTAAAAPAAAPPAATVMPAGPWRTVPLDRSAPAAQDVGAQPAPAAPPAAEGMSPSESDAVATFMQRRIVEMVQDGRDAEDVVDFIEEIDPSMNDLLAQFSPEMVTTFLSTRPIIGEATQLPHWNIFLIKAQRYIKEIRAEDAAIETAARAVPA